VHVPFCEKKCTYCDFYSIESAKHIDAYVLSVLDEIRIRRGLIQTEARPQSIFFGGGTPTLLSPEQVQTILHELPPPDSDAEITMEANPGTISLESLQGYRLAGVNRLSIGIQSFQSAELEFLTRIHSAQQATQAVHLAREAGFDNVNIDIMFALPGQTLATLHDTLRRVLDLAPEHVSAYSLVYEHGTPLYRQLNKGLVLPTPDDDDAAMYELVTSTLAKHGYQQYEVSNFAKPGKQCRHNLAYWHGLDHLSVGPSAHGLLNGTRYWNHRSLTSWMQLVERGLAPQANTEVLSPEERLREFLFLALRSDGLPTVILQDRYGIDIRSALGTELEHWVIGGLITDRGEHLQLTARGYAICDEITIRMMACLSPLESLPG
jgi:oxygen-independent coproporphyrinogen-3 oxidase